MSNWDNFCGLLHILCGNLYHVYYMFILCLWGNLFVFLILVIFVNTGFYIVSPLFILGDWFLSRIFLGILSILFFSLFPRLSMSSCFCLQGICFSISEFG
jgi:hypothetical protein